MSVLRFEDFERDSNSPEFLYITYSKYDKDWSSIMHSHSISEMMFITGGTGSLIMHDREYTLEANDFVFIPPHALHTEKSSSSSPLEYYVMGVADIQLMLDDSETFSPKIELGASTEEFRNLFINIYREMQKKRECYRMMITSDILKMIVLLSRRRKLDFAFEESIALRPDLANVKAYIDSKYSEHITLDSLASIANMSKFHLVREFSKALGESPIEYLQNKRIDEAKVLLVSTGMSVSQISSSVGFSSSSYFSQRFKLTLGITPMEFRSGIKM